MGALGMYCIHECCNRGSLAKDCIVLIASEGVVHFRTLVTLTQTLT